MKRALIALGLTLALAGCSKKPEAAASAPQEQTQEQKDTEEVNQYAKQAQEHVPQRTADNPDLNYVKVDVVDQGVVWNDWMQSKIRVIKATLVSGGDIYFYCDTAIRGAQNQILTLNGKPMPNHTCFALRLHAVYELHEISPGDTWFYLYPPGDDGTDDSDEVAAKRPMFRYCPKCKPDGDSQ